MIKNLNKILFIQCIIVTAIICSNLRCIAQPEQVIHGENSSVTVTDEENNSDNTLKAIEPQKEDTAINKNIVKHSLAFQILGRELTQREKENYGDLSKEELKNILAGEQRLAIVRALITVGAESTTKDVLAVYNISKLQTYNELVDYFTGLIEKYGSVKTGIESEYIYNIKDNEQAFKKAASKAYETVFGVPEDKQDKEQIYSFLTQSNTLTYSKMIQALMQTITPDIKKQMLFNALDQADRSDLKSNDKFINKMLEQDFTYENLMELFKELKNTAPVQGKSPQKK